MRESSSDANFRTQPPNMIAIHQVAQDSGQLEQFLRVPDLVYREDANYCCSSKENVLSNLWREQFTGRQQVFVATQNGTPVARIVARVSTDLRDEAGNPSGMLGPLAS